MRPANARPASARLNAGRGSVSTGNAACSAGFSLFNNSTVEPINDRSTQNALLLRSTLPMHPNAHLKNLPTPKPFDPIGLNPTFKFSWTFCARRHSRSTASMPTVCLCRRAGVIKSEKPRLRAVTRALKFGLFIREIREIRG